MAVSCSLLTSSTAGRPQGSYNMHPCVFLRPQPSHSGMPTRLFCSRSILESSHPNPGTFPVCSSQAASSCQAAGASSLVLQQVLPKEGLPLASLQVPTGSKVA